MCIVEWTERFFLGQDEFKQKTLPPGKERKEEEEEEGETSLHTAVLFDVLLSRSKHESVHSNECLFMHSIRMCRPSHQGDWFICQKTYSVQEIYSILKASCQSCNQKSSSWGRWWRLWPVEAPRSPWESPVVPDAKGKYVELRQQEQGTLPRVLSEKL